MTYLERGELLARYDEAISKAAEAVARGRRSEKAIRWTSRAEAFGEVFGVTKATTWVRIEDAKRDYQRSVIIGPL